MGAACDSHDGRRALTPTRRVMRAGLPRQGEAVAKAHGAMTISDRTDILLVDDEPRNLLALQQLLDAPDRNLVLANSGDEALRAVLKHDFAVILLDVRMPELDGFETAKLIRSRIRSQQTPIIFVTGVYEDITSVSRGYQVGAVDYILKPIATDVLSSKVTVFVELYRKTAALNRQKEAFREEALASEQRFYDLVQGLDAIVWEASSDERRFSFVSQRAEAILGYPVSQWLATADFRGCIAAADDWPRAGAAYQRCVRDSRGESIEYRAKGADGREIWLRDHVHVKLGADGKTRLRGVMVDITRYKEIEASLASHSEQLEELVEARTAELSALSAHVENVREEEKAGIARELHDELGSILTALALDFSWLQKQLDHAGKPVADKLKGAKGLLESAVKTTRGIMQDLRPTILDDLGLCAAIRWQVDEFAGRNSIACDVTLQDDLVTFDNVRAISLFRILQEALTNITRHAQATGMRIFLGVRDDAVVFEIADNGVGLAANAPRKPMSHGLIGMRERARRLGGKISIDGQPGRGTVITVELPPVNTVAPTVVLAADNPTPPKQRSAS